MTLSLSLPPDLEDRLQDEATRQGLSVDALVLRLLDLHLSAKEARGELVTLLQAWIEGGDAREQRETGEYLIRALDRDRLSGRLLFPPELERVTW
jgi:hypothetical protein